MYVKKPSKSRPGGLQGKFRGAVGRLAPSGAFLEASWDVLGLLERCHSAQDASIRVQELPSGFQELQDALKTTPET